MFKQSRVHTRLVAQIGMVSEIYTAHNLAVDDYGGNGERLDKEFLLAREKLKKWLEIIVDEYRLCAFSDDI